MIYIETLVVVLLSHDLWSFSSIKWWLVPIWPQGHNQNKIYRGLLDNATNLISKPYSCWQYDILSFSCLTSCKIKKTLGQDQSWYKLEYMYQSSKPFGSWQDVIFFKLFPIQFYIKSNDSWGEANTDPRLSNIIIYETQQLSNKKYHLRNNFVEFSWNWPCSITGHVF